jgi:acetyl esterase/lipase
MNPSPLAAAPLTVELFDRSALPPGAADIPEVVDEGGRLTNVHVPTLSVYLPEPAKATGCGMVVCPGGGYRLIAAAHEGRDMARWLNANGIAAFVLRYRLPPHYRHPVPRDDAREAFRMVRRRAAEWGVRTDAIGILGFSAGGHLASSLLTQLEPGEAGALSRPDFGVLLYPVITMTQPWGHADSRQGLLGAKPTAAACHAVSSEFQVSPQTPPVFLAHSFDDDAVPVQNSIEFALALKCAGVPVELHVFAAGGHGYGLGNPKSLQGRWPAMCVEWIGRMGFTGRT